MHRALCLVLVAASIVPLSAARLTYGTFVPGGGGASSVDGVPLQPRSVADAAGNTYIAATRLTVIPSSSGVTQFSYAPFVEKISADGAKVVFTTTFSGGIATAITLDPAGNIYVGGGTSQGSRFVVKLDPNGALIFNSRIGALPLALAADAESVYAAGTVGAHAFVARYAGDGSSTLFGITLAGSGNDSGLAIAIDPAGSVLVAGQTSSPDFPTTSDAFQPKLRGTANGFVMRMDATGHTLYSTFFGGSGSDSITSIALDAGRNAYLAGSTTSPDLPVSPAAYQAVYGGAGDAFFAKLNPAGQTVFTSYLGAAATETAAGSAPWPNNRFYVGVNEDNPSPLTPCDSTIAVVAIDSMSGQVVDRYALRPFGSGEQLNPGSLSIDRAGIIHIAGMAGYNPLDNPFPVTPDPLSLNDTAFLARIDFSSQESLSVSCMVNAASFDNLDLSVAPGEIVSIFGKGLGPAGGIAAQPDSNGNWPRQLGTTAVLLNGKNLPLLYASDTQVNAIVPYSLATGSAIPLSSFAIFDGSAVVSYPLQTVWTAWPGIFTQDGEQAAVLNQDGSINSSGHPAPVGSVVSFFATGMGALTGSISDIASTPLSPPWPGLATQLGVYIAANADFGAVGMEVTYAGPAPGLAPGVYQVNARVPSNAVAGKAPIRFTMGICGGVVIPQCTPITEEPYIWVQPQ